ncbi:MAG: trypsin-like peptidase domain-containing protein [Burkholderiales bacterium]|nr:trypsin-like peptidase domain-containing protein [Burkholderiales bacterium]
MFPLPRRARGRASDWILFALAVGALLWWWRPWEGMISAGPARVDAAPRPVEARGDLAQDEQNNIAVFRSASPSTVHITTLASRRNLFSMDILQIPQGTGTGFIWDESGNVVTNFHVIQGANAAKVTLSDQTTWNAALGGAFPDRDLAVLRIDAPRDKLRPIALGSSRALQVGQKVYAIGNPFGLDQTLTTGIISALNREIESVTQRTIRGVIQTDAAINPGNSGGPLLDSAGRLIGVNTAIYSPSGASAGIGFAIPADEVNRIVPQLIAKGRVIRPTLGIEAAPPQVRAALGAKSGVAVVRVIEGSGAAQAGMRPFTLGPSNEVVPGDVIVAIDGKPVQDLDALQDELERRQPGDTVKVSVERAGKAAEFQVRLGVPG